MSSSSSTSSRSALEDAITAADRSTARLDRLRADLPSVLRPFETLSDIPSNSSDPPQQPHNICIDSSQGEIALCRFQLGLRYHIVRLVANLPLLSHLAYGDVSVLADSRRGESGSSSARLLECARSCVESALRVVSSPQSLGSGCHGNR